MPFTDVSADDTSPGRDRPPGGRWDHRWRPPRPTSPSAHVQRAQMASFVTRSAERAAHARLRPASDHPARRERRLRQPDAWRVGPPLRRHPQDPHQHPRVGRRARRRRRQRHPGPGRPPPRRLLRLVGAAPDPGSRGRADLRRPRRAHHRRPRPRHRGPRLVRRGADLPLGLRRPEVLLAGRMDAHGPRHGRPGRRALGDPHGGTAPGPTTSTQGPRGAAPRGRGRRRARTRTTTSTASTSTTCATSRRTTATTRRRWRPSGRRRNRTGPPAPSDPEWTLAAAADPADHPARRRTAIEATGKDAMLSAAVITWGDGPSTPDRAGFQRTFSYTRVLQDWDRGSAWLHRRGHADELLPGARRHPGAPVRELARLRAGARA
jgi:hypothetical protein